MEAKVRALMERIWKDVESLPWQDPSWTSNKTLRQQTRQHFVGATTDDVMLLFNQLKLVEEDKDATTDDSN